MTDDPLKKLLDTLEELRATTDRAKQQPLWKNAFNLLKKLPVDQNRAANVIAGRNLTGLATLVAELRDAQQDSDAAAAVPDAVHVAARESFDDETLKAAMKLFRRRVKFSKLNEESRLGRNPLTSGDRIQSFAIEAPGDYPRVVWDELVRRGELRYTGKGFYELTEAGRG